MWRNVNGLSIHLFIQKIMNPQQIALVTDVAEMSKRPCSSFCWASFLFQGTEIQQVKMKYSRGRPSPWENKAGRREKGGEEGLGRALWQGGIWKETQGSEQMKHTLTREADGRTCRLCGPQRRGGIGGEDKDRLGLWKGWEPRRDFRKGETRPNLDFKRNIPATVWKWTAVGVRVAEMAMWRPLDQPCHRQWWLGPHDGTGDERQEDSARDLKGEPAELAPGPHVQEGEGSGLPFRC